jgi:hypothetical protein
MAQVQIIFWREFPAQVQAKDESGTVRLPLPERFQQAIDAAAMNAGITGTDAYLDDWQHGGWEDHPGSAQQAAEAVHAQVVADYPPKRLAEMVREAGGVDS